MINEANDHPRHATGIQHIQSKPERPLVGGGVGFEPTGPYGTGPPIFRIGAIDLSAIPPIYT